MKRRSAMEKALTKLARTACLTAMTAISFVGMAASSAQAQSWHYQNCLRNSCLPAYWACRRVATYPACSSQYSTCTGQCWGTHLLSRAVEVDSYVQRNRAWRNWNWANRGYRSGYSGGSYARGGGSYGRGGGGSYGRGSGRSYGRGSGR